MIFLLFACDYMADAPVRELQAEAEATAAQVELAVIAPPPHPVTAGQVRLLITADELVVDPSHWVNISFPDDGDWRESRRTMKLTRIPLSGGRVADDLCRGQLVSPLYDALLETAETHKELGNGGGPEFKGQIHIVADQSIPWETIRRVLFTAGQAQYGNYEFGVEGGITTFVSAYLGRLPIALGNTTSFLSAPPDLTVEGPHMARVATAAIPSEMATLRSHFPDLHDVVIFPDQDATWQQTLATSTDLNERAELCALGGVDEQKDPQAHPNLEALLRSLGPAHVARLDHPERLKRIGVGEVTAKGESLRAFADLARAARKGQGARIRGPLLDCALLHLTEVNGRGMVRIDTGRGAPNISVSGTLGEAFTACVTTALQNPDNHLHSIDASPSMVVAMFNPPPTNTQGIQLSLEVAVQAGDDLKASVGQGSLMDRGHAIASGSLTDTELHQGMLEARLEIERLWAQAARIQQAKTWTELDAVLQSGPRSPALRAMTHQRVTALVGPLEEQIRLIVQRPHLTEAVAALLGEAEPTDLVDVLLRSDDNDIRRAAAGLLAGHVDPEAPQALIDGLNPDIHRRGPWGGGALFIPRAAYSEQEAAAIVDALMRFSFRDPTNRSTVNNALTNTMMRQAGYRCSFWRANDIPFADCMPPEHYKALLAKEGR